MWSNNDGMDPNWKPYFPPADCSECEKLKAELERVKAERDELSRAIDSWKQEEQDWNEQMKQLRADLGVAVECIALAQTSECADYCEPSAQDPSKRAHSVYCEVFSEALGKMGK
jgi:hypothetical protein